MRIRVVGQTAGSGRPPFLTSFIVNDTVAIDAGAVGLLDDLSAQERITDVVLSHSHLDHTSSLPLWIENTYAPGGRVPRIFGSAAAIDSLRRDFFNDRVWPDLPRIGSKLNPFMEFVTFENEVPLRLGNLSILPVAVDHTVPCSGFLIDDGRSLVVISSDTSATTRLWELARASDRLRAVFIECSFPEEEAEMARITGHLTPKGVRGELEKLGREVPAIAYHLKPRYFDRLVSELGTWGGATCRVADPLEVYNF